MGRHKLKASNNLRSLVRHSWTDKNSEIPTFLSLALALNMKNLKNIFSVILALAILSGILYFIYLVIITFIENIDKIDPNIFIAIIAGAVTITGYFITRYLERKKLIEQQIRDQKLPTYEEFLDFMFEIFNSTKTEKPSSQEDLQKFFWKFNKKAILWLSDRTLKSYIEWRNSLVQFSKKSNSNESDNAKTLVAFEKLLLDFRKDIGHDNKNFETGNILSMFINDWDSYSHHLKK